MPERAINKSPHVKEGEEMVTLVKNYVAIGRGIFLIILEALCSRGMLIFYFWVLAAINICSGIYRHNGMVLSGYFVGLLLVLIHFGPYEHIIAPCFNYLKHRIIDGMDHEKARKFTGYDFQIREPWNGPFYLPERAHVYLIVVLGIIPLLFSTITNTSYNFFERAKYAVVSGKVLPLDGKYVLSNPFAPVTWIMDEHMSQTSTLSAKTRDNIPIAIEVNSKLRLRPEKKAILNYTASPESVRLEFDGRLEKAFQKIAGSMDLNEIPNGPMLTRLIYLEAINTPEGLPLMWDREFSLTAYKIIIR